MNKLPIYNMDGYLLSLRRLSSDKCDFWAEILDIDGDIESCLDKHFAKLNVKLIDKSPAGYQEIEALLMSEFNAKLNLQDDALVRSFVWDLLEYFQHSFLEYSVHNDPINRKQSFIIRATTGDNTDSYHIIVPVKTKAIAVVLLTRQPNRSGSGLQACP